MMYYLKCPLPAFLKSLRAPPNNCNNIPFLMSTFSYILGARERERGSRGSSTQFNIGDSDRYLKHVPVSHICLESLISPSTVVHVQE